MMAATGISAILTRYAEALFVLKIFGGLYLLYLAYKAGRAALTSDDKAREAMSKDAALSGASLYRRGLLMHLTNPKSILAWIALMTLGLGPGASTHTLVAILGGCAVLSVTIFCGYAIVFSTARFVMSSGISMPEPPVPTAARQVIDDRRCARRIELARREGPQRVEIGALLAVVAGRERGAQSRERGVVDVHGRIPFASRHARRSASPR